ncbi:MAG: heavy metal translocating P-type ATPase [Chloroflexota bacterium]
MPFESLQMGDLVVVTAGQTIPIDGTIRNGYASIDQRTLTGESQPVEKVVDEPVFASTVVLEGRIEIQVEKRGDETVAAQIGTILNATTDFKSQVQSRGNKIVDQGAMPTVALSLLALPLFGAESALTMLYAAFGYHMRHAAPISVLNYLRFASERGVLIKDGRSLELMTEVDTVVFDKTGTLTEDVPIVGQIHPCGQHTKEGLLAVAAAAEEKQSHPIALAILEEARSQSLSLPMVLNVKYEVGYGLKVSIFDAEKEEEQLIRVGSRRFMAMEDIAIDERYDLIENAAHEKGHTLIYVAIGDQLGGVIELEPKIRPEAKHIVEQLRQRHMSLVIISGDHEKPTRQLAHSVGIEQYFAETLPQNKASIVKQLQDEGKSVCFIGDGINDSIALKTANVSISLRDASTAATDSAAIILMNSNLNQLIPLLDIANSLETNLNRGMAMTIVPGIICVGGVIFFHFGLFSGLVLYYGGLVASLSNALIPLVFSELRDKGI